MSDPSDAVSVHPVFLWIVAICFVAYVIVQYSGKISTGFNEIADNSTERKRRHRQDRLSLVEEDMAWATSRIEELAEDSRERDRLAENHSKWDHDMIMKLIRLDPHIELSDPPPIVPQSRVTYEPPPSKKDNNAST